MGICLGSWMSSKSAMREKLDFPNLPIWTAIWGAEGIRGLGKGEEVSPSHHILPLLAQGTCAANTDWLDEVQGSRHAGNSAL